MWLVLPFFTVVLIIEGIQFLINNNGKPKNIAETIVNPEEVETEEGFAAENVTFYLFNNEDYKASYAKIHESNLEQVAKRDERTYFLLHGWLGNREKPWYENLKNALLERDPKANVVQVDWSYTANQSYSISAYHTEHVGEIVANLLYKLHSVHQVPAENLVLIGHSLGGQICGWAGKMFQSKSQQKLARIIALDPAGPLFNLRSIHKKLHKDDAEIVHVVHTNGGLYGYLLPCGTIEFYPNGGSFQKGCPITLDVMSDEAFCSHQRAYDIFPEAVRDPQSFMAQKCLNWAMYQIGFCKKVEVAMGDLWTTETGSFYLSTNGQSPFSQSN